MNSQKIGLQFWQKHKSQNKINYRMLYRFLSFSQDMPQYFDSKSNYYCMLQQGPPFVNPNTIFGFTANAHSNLMGAIWGPAINVGIILSFYGYRKWWGLLHGLVGLVACFYSLITAIPMIVHMGIIPQGQTKDFFFYTAKTIRIHQLVGISCLCVIVIQTLMGVITRMMIFAGFNTLNLIKMKRVHGIFGYIMIILCKANYVIIGDIGFLYQDFAFIVLVIVWKTKFPKLQTKTVPRGDISNIREVNSLKDMDPGRNYVIYANRIYDIEPLRRFHPGGYQIIDSVKNKEIDRYVYGMYSSQELPQVPQYSHSFRSLTLVGDPVAKLGIPSTFSGLTDDRVEVSISNMKIISEKGKIYEMRLSRKQGRFDFQKYTEVTQLGRYYSITLNEETTRLYTSVNFLIKANKQFMKKHLKNFSGWYGKAADYKSEVQMDDSGQTTARKMASEHYVPILFKQYDNGKFTDSIVKAPVRNLFLSSPKGEGLQFSHLKPGKVVIVAGGTGIYPFADLIDLLFKDEIMKQEPSLAETIIELSPVLKKDIFKSLSFLLLAAFNNFDDIHPITFHQMAYLSSRKRLSLTLKVKDSNNEGLKVLSNVKLVKGSFEAELQGQLKVGEVSKVWICGPPRMNENVSKFLRDKYKVPQLYLII